jgi:hypothetical protein
VTLDNDPLGMSSPVAVRSKIFLQDLWNRKLDWDEIIPQEIMTHWNKINQDMENCTAVSLMKANVVLFDCRSIKRIFQHVD